MGEVYVLVTMKEFDEAEGVEPEVRVYGDHEEARDAFADAVEGNDYVAVLTRDVIERCDPMEEGE